MARKSVSPITTWIFWSVLVLGVFLTVTRDYFVAGFSADSSKISWLIMGFFVYGFLASLAVAYHLQSEFKSLLIMETECRVVDPNSSDAASLFDAALQRAGRGERVDMRNLVASYGAKLKGRVDNVSVISGMLITIGLLGTVMGLIVTVSGLDEVLQSSSSDFASMKAGMTKTVSGMGTAFYTTFFGALLGGVVLKVLGAEMKKSSTCLVADALRFAELFIAPQFHKHASEALVELEGGVEVVSTQLKALSGSFSGVIETIDSKQSALAEGLGGLLATVENTNAAANERTQALIGAIATAMEDSSRQADERLGVMSAAINDSRDETKEVTRAMIESINSSTENTARLADERLNSITQTITSAAEQSEQTSTERVEALAQAVAKTLEESHRVADERLKLLIEAVEVATSKTHDKADAHLADFVKNVEASIKTSSKKAEESLGAKASDLAVKLSEAAGMLSGLVSSTTTAVEQANGE